ncbi:MAG: carbohydrate ABC transporter permease [Arachnia sp.]
MTGRHIKRLVTTVGLLAISVTAILPFVLMLITAIQDTAEISFSIDLDLLTLKNFTSLFTVQDFGGALVNSLIIVAIAIVLNNAVAALAAYGFVFRRFPGSEGLFWVYLATMMVPIQVTMIPMFIMFREAGVLGTHFTLALPVVNAFGVYLTRQFMLGVPPSLIEAARIDGASDLVIFLRIVVPVIKPVLIALTVFTFLTTWNDFMWPLISIQETSMQTVTLAVSRLRGSFATQYGLVMAGATVAFLVPFLVYVFLQRRFVEGVTGSGVKG